ncbi:MAG TPA: hypothetical protein VFS16_00140 [Acidimicrobiia bacterium]|nr:hypothetical protein [Acidimicrobiia bacterium]
MRCRTPRKLVVAGMVAVALAAGGAPVLLPAGPAEAAETPEVSPGDPRLLEMASPSPFRGMIYTGLSLGRKGTACDGAFEVRTRQGGSLGCSHGPDPAPPGVDVRRGRSDQQLLADARTGAGRTAAAIGPFLAGAGDPSGAAAAAVGAVGCIGNGVSGTRVQAVYAVPANRPNRSATVIPAIRSTYAPRIDWQLNQSAAETGGEAHVTFVTEPGTDGTGCRLAVSVAQLSPSAVDSFSDTVTELKALGFNRPDRKYLVWTDADVLCGVGSMYSDSRPGQGNLNNGYAAMYARVDTGCWGYAEGHELMHNLGAVQRSAPHATAAGHCTDVPDDMCYDDDGNGPATMTTACAGRSSALFDCNHDDYFYAGVPPASNWLSNHWNTWNSSWLLRAPLPAVATVPTPTGGSGTTTPTGTTDGSGSGTTTGSTSGTGGGSVIGLPPIPPPPPIAPVAPKATATGYWMLTSDGHVHPFGDTTSFGEPFPIAGGVRAVDLEPSPSGFGYWIVDESGRVRAYGDARRHGSIGSNVLDPGERAVSLSATPTGDGYWVFTSRGRAVPFGDAGFFGDVADLALNRPVIGSVATPSGKGYYLFAADGGIFTFGDAAFFGSTGAMRLNKPIVAMAVAPGQGGYWLVGADGGLFAFGTAGFYGSMGAVPLNRPVSAVVPGQAGYLMVGEDGGAFSFGDVLFFGSLGKNPPPTPVVSVALRD